jgi:hypothetical protein
MKSEVHFYWAAAAVIIAFITCATLVSIFGQ